MPKAQSCSKPKDLTKLDKLKPFTFRNCDMSFMCKVLILV